ncbi:MAG: C-factor, partial [Pseudomonadota bacterium]
RLLDVLDRLDTEQSGSFHDFEGQRLPF